MVTNHKKTTALQSVDLTHPSGGQTMPWNWLGSNATNQQACSSLRPSFTHQQADTSCKKRATTQPTDIAHTLAGQIHPEDQLGP